MTFCTQCGKPIEEGGQFCGYCGKPVQNLVAVNSDKEEIVQMDSDEQQERQTMEAGIKTSPSDKKPPKKKRGLALVLVLFGILLVGGAGFFISQSLKNRETEQQTGQKNPLDAETHSVSGNKIGSAHETGTNQDVEGTSNIAEIDAAEEPKYLPIPPEKAWLKSLSYEYNEKDLEQNNQSYAHIFKGRVVHAYGGTWFTGTIGQNNDGHWNGSVDSDDIYFLSDEPGANPVIVGYVPRYKKWTDIIYGNSIEVLCPGPETEEGRFLYYMTKCQEDTVDGNIFLFRQNLRTAEVEKVKEVQSVELAFRTSDNKLCWLDNGALYSLNLLDGSVTETKGMELESNTFMLHGDENGVYGLTYSDDELMVFRMGLDMAEIEIVHSFNKDVLAEKNPAFRHAKLLKVFFPWFPYTLDEQKDNLFLMNLTDGSEILLKNAAESGLLECIQEALFFVSSYQWFFYGINGAFTGIVSYNINTNELLQIMSLEKLVASMDEIDLSELFLFFLGIINDSLWLWDDMDDIYCVSGLKGETTVRLLAESNDWWDKEKMRKAEGDWVFLEFPNCIMIEDYTGKEVTVTVPSYLASKPVTMVDFGENLKDNTTLEKLILPEGINAIHNLFAGPAMKELVLPKSLRHLTDIQYTLQDMDQCDILYPGTVDEWNALCEYTFEMYSGARIVSGKENVFKEVICSDGIWRKDK